MPTPGDPVYRWPEDKQGALRQELLTEMFPLVRFDFPKPPPPSPHPLGLRFNLVLVPKRIDPARLITIDGQLHLLEPWEEDDESVPAHDRKPCAIPW